MGDFGCGNGGWTPVMKIDRNKVYYKPEPTFSKLSSYFLVASQRGFKQCNIFENDLSSQVKLSAIL